MGLFGIGRELKFRVCNHSKPRASPHMARTGECFHGEKKEVGRVIVKQSPWLSIGLDLAKKEEESTFFLLGSAISFQGLRASPLISQLYLIKVSMYFIYLFIYFTFTPFDQDLSLKEPLIKS